ncbi:RND transporter [Achromatium sp. WMS2]|nr:RND transporter [Achromatium sp. WMS2]
MIGAALATPIAYAQNSTNGRDYFVIQKTERSAIVSIGGTVVPYREVTLSAQLPGRIVRLAGIEGDRFKKGSVLVVLDTAELMAKRRAAEAQMSSAIAQMNNAGVQYSREIWSPRSDASPGGMGMPNLFDQMFTKPMENWVGRRQYGAERYSDIYSSGVRIQEAQSAIARMRAEIQQIDAKLRDARSIAPFDGVIMQKFIEAGDTVQPGQPLLKYADVEFLQMEVDVPARLRSDLQEMMILNAQLDMDNRIIPVRVAQIFPMADVQRHTVRVKFDLPQFVATPGMYAKVLIPDSSAPKQTSPIIPRSAICYNGSLPVVYVQDTDGSDKIRLIRLGEQLPPNFITVLSGLQAGDKVLGNPAANPPSSSWSCNNPHSMPDR